MLEKVTKLAGAAFVVNSYFLNTFWSSFSGMLLLRSWSCLRRSRTSWASSWMRSWSTVCGSRHFVRCFSRRVLRDFFITALLYIEVDIFLSWSKSHGEGKDRRAQPIERLAPIPIHLPHDSRADIQAHQNGGEHLVSQNSPLGRLASHRRTLAMSTGGGVSTFGARFDALGLGAGHSEPCCMVRSHWRLAISCASRIWYCARCQAFH